MGLDFVFGFVFVNLLKQFVGKCLMLVNIKPDETLITLTFFIDSAGVQTRRLCYQKQMTIARQQCFDKAGWQSGYAAACKAVYAGSIPTPASNIPHARMVKLVDTRDLKSLASRHAGSSPALGSPYAKTHGR